MSQPDALRGTQLIRPYLADLGHLAFPARCNLAPNESVKAVHRQIVPAVREKINKNTWRKRGQPEIQKGPLGMERGQYPTVLIGTDRKSRTVPELGDSVTGHSDRMSG